MCTWLTVDGELLFCIGLLVNLNSRIVDYLDTVVWVSESFVSKFFYIGKPVIGENF